MYDTASPNGMQRNDILVGSMQCSRKKVRFGPMCSATESFNESFNEIISEFQTTGKGQAKIAGKYLRSTHIHFDAVYTSLLTRAIRTTELILNEMPGMYNDTIEYSWLLNERHYGALTGQRKKDESERTENWNTRPLPMLPDHPYYDVIYTDPRYENISSENCFPYTETLADAQLRFVRIWLATIASQVQNGKRILIVAHHNLLLGVIKYFDLVSDEAIMKIKIKNSVPFIYNFDENLIPQNKFAYLYGATESESKNTTTN